MQSNVNITFCIAHILKHRSNVLFIGLAPVFSSLSDLHRSFYPPYEALFSIDTWATRFRWTRGKTRCFFARLQRQNLIRLIPNPHTTHLVVNDYNLWTGCRDAARQHLAQQADEAFDHFWETYHYITQADKVNIARARREWRKLSPEERTLAVRHIEEYYYHLRSQKYCMQAAAYLSNKAFLNEYND